jgi:hypothetical protein
MNSVLLWFGGLLVVIFTALFAVPHVVDWNSYRGVFEEEATRVLGRKVRVGGSVNLRLLPVPYVRFEKVRIADDTGTLGAPFFSADGFTLWLSVPPLLRGILEAKQVELEQPVLNLAVNREGGNWGSFRISAGALPFVPNDVALQSMKITDGRISLRLGGTSETVVLSNIGGELAAETLHGPYRFQGEADFENTRHEVRVSSGQPEADGSLRVRAVARNAAGGSFVIDGTAGDLVAAPRFSGQLSANIPFALYASNSDPETTPQPGDQEVNEPDQSGTTGEARGAAAEAGRSEPAPRAGRRNGFDVKGKLDVSPVGFKLSELLASFDSDGRPQLMTGEASGEWRSVPKINVDLSARWLDIDRIAGGGDGREPLVTAREMGRRIFDLVLKSWDAEARLKVDQANLGRDIVGDLVIDVARAAGRDLDIREVAGALPGGVRFRTNGVLSGRGETHSYNGDLVVYGSSIGRFTGWAGRGGWQVPAKLDRSFSVAGKVVLSERVVGITEAVAEIGRRQMRGSLTKGLGAKPELVVTLEGDDIDIGPLAPGLLQEVAVRPLDFIVSGAGSKPATATAGAGAKWLASFDGDFRIDIKAGRLEDGTTVLRDVEVRVTRSQQAVGLQSIKWRTAKDLAVDAKGTVPLDGKNPARINGWIRAGSNLAVRQLAEAVGVDGALSAMVSSVVSTAPSLAVGFRTTLPINEGAPFETVLDGVIGRHPVRSSLKLGGGIEGWRKGDIAAELDLSAETFGDLMRAAGHAHGMDPMVPAKAVEGSAKSAGSARMIVRASGGAAERLTVVARLTSAEMVANFEGKGGFGDSGSVRLAGKLEVGADDVRPLLKTVAQGWRPELEKAALGGFILVELDEGTLKLAPQALALGSTRASGTLQVSKSKQAAGAAAIYALSGALDLNVLSLDSAIGLIVAGGTPRQDGTRWSEAPIQLDLVEHVTGGVLVRADEVFVGNSLVLTDSSSRLRLTAGRVGFEEINGTIAGGTFSGRMSVERRPAGVNAAITAKVEAADLAALTALGGGKSVAQGRGSLTLELSGNGLSPRAVVAGITGRGSVEVRDATIAGLSTDAVSSVAAVVIAKGREATETTGEIIARELQPALAAGSLEVGTRKIALNAGDGALRFEQFTVKGKDGTARNTTTIDLISLKFDSEWQLASAMKPREGSEADKPAAQLPPVSVLYVGELDRLTTVEPRLVTDALDRELTVLRMERSVQRLEELRRKDEELARQEELRQKAIAEEKRRALEAYRREMGLPGGATGEPPPVIQYLPPGAIPPGGPAQLGGPIAAPPAPRPAQRRPQAGAGQRPGGFNPWADIDAR